MLTCIVHNNQTNKLATVDSLSPLIITSLLFSRREVANAKNMMIVLAPRSLVLQQEYAPSLMYDDLLGASMVH
jgi:hypothetical protein